MKWGLTDEQVEVGEAGGFFFFFPLSRPLLLAPGAGLLVSARIGVFFPFVFLCFVCFWDRFACFLDLGMFGVCLFLLFLIDGVGRLPLKTHEKRLKEAGKRKTPKKRRLTTFKRKKKWGKRKKQQPKKSLGVEAQCFLVLAFGSLGVHLDHR
ncbi:hypothetical protein B0J18DRAFT_438076 [Chaetomium sp. MPI-SDFR-AT-0129]|nr:hypothetical protein B0J18DRAFT_438076 [Chaetomium sp. MPI-SDFR-AT-0129]